MNLFTIEKNTKESAYYDFEETKEMNWKIRVGKDFRQNFREACSITK